MLLNKSYNSTIGALILGVSRKSDEFVLKMRSEYRHGKNMTQIAKDYSLSYCTVYNIVRGRGIYKDIC